MCGIVGYVGDRSCRELLLHGLERLEYRGYDSAGLSLLGDGQIESVRAVGNLSRLREAVDASESNGGAAVATKIAEATTGIGHTRWATHGRPSERNAHPHPDCTGRVHIVLNGIIENYVELRAALEAEGHHFASETDAEAVAHLIEKHLDDARPRQPARGDAARVPGPARPLRVRRGVARTSPTRSSARARTARWWSASARASTSSPPRSPPSCARRAMCSWSATTRS